MTRCLAPDCQMGGLGCDNMTVVLVCFLHGGSYHELAEKCSRPPIHLPDSNAGNEDQPGPWWQPEQRDWLDSAVQSCSLSWPEPAFLIVTQLNRFVFWYPRDAQPRFFFVSIAGIELPQTHSFILFFWEDYFILFHSYYFLVLLVIYIHDTTFTFM